MQDTIQDVTNTGFIAHSDAFSIATLMYARMRRVAGRMIDVMYLVENKAYAGYIIQHAALLQDEELDRLINRLQALILKESQIEIHDEDDSVQNKENLETFSESTGQSEVTNEEYQAQVSHHYIGALR
ncbi:hypothetical protein FW754_03415 [Acinetobacter sp. 1207_04]|uniref:hypothetical protein n=1 Tax=Acinetobacter sp. 1207_04 TaxID=2604449 RepID=UPI003072B30A